MGVGRSVGVGGNEIVEIKVFYAIYTPNHPSYFISLFTQLSLSLSPSTFF
jgi:hypothetical protein